MQAKLPNLKDVDVRYTEAWWSSTICPPIPSTPPPHTYIHTQRLKDDARVHPGSRMSFWRQDQDVSFSFISPLLVKPDQEVDSEPLHGPSTPREILYNQNFEDLCLCEAFVFSLSRLFVSNSTWIWFLQRTRPLFCVLFCDGGSISEQSNGFRMQLCPHQSAASEFPSHLLGKWRCYRGERRLCLLLMSKERKTTKNKIFINVN